MRRPKGRMGGRIALALVKLFQFLLQLGKLLVGKRRLWRRGPHKISQGIGRDKRQQPLGKISIDRGMRLQEVFVVLVCLNHGVG